MNNRGRKYTKKEKDFLDELSKLINTRDQLNVIAPLVADIMGRTVAGICKQIEERNYLQKV